MFAYVFNYQPHWGNNVIKALEAFIIKWENYFGVLAQTETYLSFLKIKEIELLAINK